MVPCSFAPVLLSFHVCGINWGIRLMHKQQLGKVYLNLMIFVVIVHQTGVDGCVIHLVERKPPPLGASSLGLENCMFMCMLQLEI